MESSLVFKIGFGGSLRRDPGACVLPVYAPLCRGLKASVREIVFLKKKQTSLFEYSDSGFDLGISSWWQWIQLYTLLMVCCCIILGRNNRKGKVKLLHMIT
jgi:hypothetical protein